MSEGRSIIVVGGGASGILVSAHLLRNPDPRLRVTIVEKRGQLGRGLAFSADRADYILNVPASNMSAYADDPDHFRRWLREHHPELAYDPFLFAPRKVYGEYLGDLLAADRGKTDDPRLTIVEAECIGIRERESCAEVLLSDGTTRLAQLAILAVGHEEQPARGQGLAVRADSDADTPLPQDAPVMILGSGLSMVDAWLSLAARNHRGKVTVVSRHGLLPMTHEPVDPIKIDAADVPFGTNLHYFTRWFRQLVADAESRGENWRSVVDGLRPFNQRIWQSWTHEARRQFLEHVRPLWNVHRHRLPPRLHGRLRIAIVDGQVELVAGKFLDLVASAGGFSATFRRRGSLSRETAEVARVYDCGGVTLDVTTSSNRAIQTLLAEGSARPDDQRIGLDVTTDLNVVRADGTASPRLYAVGPLTRGKFFEIEAIPDIRRQCADLAVRLAAG